MTRNPDRVCEPKQFLHVCNIKIFWSWLMHGTHTFWSKEIVLIFGLLKKKIVDNPYVCEMVKSTPRIICWYHTGK